MRRPAKLDSEVGKGISVTITIEQIANLVIEKMGLKEDITREYLVRALECAKLFDKKQHDYGPDNIAQFGDLGVLIRLNDKIQRLKTLMLSGEQPEFSQESILDTWMDVHVYGVIGMMCIQGAWPNAYVHMKDRTDGEPSF